MDMTLTSFLALAGPVLRSLRSLCCHLSLSLTLRTTSSLLYRILLMEAHSQNSHPSDFKFRVTP